jgi:phosphopantetheinyl transferase
VPATLPGFRELCEQADLKRQVDKRLRKIGATTEAADGLLRHQVKLAQLLDARLARFKLTAFGKPADDRAGRKVSENPWAHVAGK